MDESRLPSGRGGAFVFSSGCRAVGGAGASAGPPVNGTSRESSYAVVRMRAQGPGQQPAQAVGLWRLPMSAGAPTIGSARGQCEPAPPPADGRVQPTALAALRVKVPPPTVPFDFSRIATQVEAECPAPVPGGAQADG